jgi:restriction system protein
VVARYQDYIARERRNAANERAAERAARQEERARLAAQREMERRRKEATKEAERQYQESRLAEAADMGRELEKEINRLESLLLATLDVDDFVDLSQRRVKPSIPIFAPGQLDQAELEPKLETYQPRPLSWWKRIFIPNAAAHHAQEIAEAEERFEREKAAYRERESLREHRLAEAHAAHEAEVRRIEAEAAQRNAELEAFQRAYAACEPQAVVDYCLLILERSIYPENFPRHRRVAYLPESKQLVVEADLPSFDVIPSVAAYKYVKAKDEIVSSPRPTTQRRALYASVIAQITIRTLHELFEADRSHHIATIVFSGFVDSIDPGTGRPARTCLVTVRTTRDIFASLSLRQVDPIACLKALNAGVSKSPSELAPVRPVLEFDMVDPRFIQETDVLSTLEQRPNLMGLTPLEFESLISNLFGKMGLETRVTQASRDGGVDCVAYDPRPIFGGKVVIQAKRYKHTVGVSAVRDLFGTVQNEGASKGILVTTSGYGKAAFEFAQGKPLELLSGSHLLHLLAEHAGIEARIEMPDDWKDPVPDVPGEKVDTR